MAVERKTTKRKNAAADAPTVSEYGRLQPQAMELEEAATTRERNHQVGGHKE